MHQEKGIEYIKNIAGNLKERKKKLTLVLGLPLFLLIQLDHKEHSSYCFNTRNDINEFSARGHTLYKTELRSPKKHTHIYHTNK